MNWSDVWGILGPSIIATGTSLLAFAVVLPTKLGDKLLAHHFEARLASIKHEHGKELGRLQADLDHLKDRGTRSIEREYQAISAVWEGFVEAFQATRRCVVQFMSHPNLNTMSGDEVSGFLREEAFDDADITFIMAADNRNTAYTNAVRNRLVHQAGETIIDTMRLWQKQSVFIPDDLSRQFDLNLREMSRVQSEQFVARNNRRSGELHIERLHGVRG